jgi:hypothetical protein
MIKTLTKIFAITAVTKGLLETKKVNLRALLNYIPAKFQGERFL